jgi:protein LTV1
MQHLRTVGTEASSYLVEAPTKKPKVKKAAEEDGVTLRAVPERMQIPYDALPSHPEDEISYNDLTQIQAPLISLQPDLDPSIREVLEALEDEAYEIDKENEEGGEEGVDDFWLDVVRGGEKDGEDYDEEWDDEEEAEDDDEDELEDQLGEGLEARVARFKASKKGKEVMGESDDDEDEDNISEGGDTIAALRVSNARRPPRRKAASSAGGSQFSMTSSAMFRNSGLQTLDEQFDQVRYFPPYLCTFDHSSCPVILID